MRAAGSAQTWYCVLICLSFSSCICHSQAFVTPPTGALSHANTRQPQRTISLSALGSLPLQFEENKGQADRKSRFLARGAGYTLLLDQDGLRLALRQTSQVSMRLVGAQVGNISGHEPSSASTNYYLGNDRANWHLDVRSYRSVAYSGVYKGIDLIYHGSRSQLEYDFVVAPRADPRQVRMRFKGLQLKLRHEDLAFQGVDSLEVKGLKAYQLVDGEKKAVEAAWQIHGDEASIRLGAYDRDRELIIDPVFFYGTYIGGLASDAAVSVVAASQPGYYYVALSTSSDSLSDHSPPPGSASSTVTGTLAMIVGIDATGSPGPASPLPPYSPNEPASYPSLLVNSVTYVGGTTGDITPTGMVGDQSGNLYITGTTDNGAKFVPPAKQPCSPSCTGFVAKFATSIDTGTTPAKATVTQKYSFGLPAMPMAIAVDTSGDVYLTGAAYATSGKPMLTIPLDDTTFQSTAAPAIGTDANPHAFLLELDPAGATLFCSYIGGSGPDRGNALALSDNSVFVAGQTTSTDFPKTSKAFQPNNNGGQDGFVLAASKLSTSPSLDFSTYLGGSGTDAVASIAVTPAGNPVVTGSTTSSSKPTFPIQPNASFVQLTWPTPSFQSTDSNLNTNNTSQVPTKPPKINKLPTTVTAGNQDAFVTSLSGDGTQLLFTDFLGGDDPNDVTSGQAVTVDSIGVIYVAGSSTGAPPTTTTSNGTAPPTAPPHFLSGAAIGDLPPNSFDITPAGTITNIFFTEIDPTGGYLLEATIAGGFGTDQAGGLTISGPLASTGVVTIVGSTTADPNPIDLSTHPDFFASAGISATNPVKPAPDGVAKGDVKNTTGFLVQEALAGYCKMQLTAQTGTLLTFTGPCVSGTQSGTLFAVPSPPPSSGPAYLSAPIAVNASGSSLSASVTIDTSSLGGATADFTFAFFPLGAVGGVGQCNNNITSLTGCGILTAGGGAGTLFKVTSGTLTVSLACSGDNCNYNGAPNTALVGQPVALSATVSNGIPNTVTWTSSQGVFSGPNPAASITFTPDGTGGPVVIQATPVANPSVKPKEIMLSTIGNPAAGTSLAILASASKMVAGATFQFTANQPVNWTATAGTINSSGQFTAPNPLPVPPTVTITATSQSNPSSSVTAQVALFPPLSLVVPPQNTLRSGGSASIPISVTAGTGIPGEALLFSCAPATLPTGVSCSFSPNPVTNSGNVQLVLLLSSTTVGKMEPMGGVPWKIFSLGGSSIVVAGCILWLPRRKRWIAERRAISAALAFAFLMLLTACGTSGTFSSTSQQGHLTGTFTIDINVSGATPGAADLNQTVATAHLSVTLQ